MQAIATTTEAPDQEAGAAGLVSPEVHETAARLGALIRYLFLFDGGEHLQAIEQSGLTMTQCKTLLMLAGGGDPKPAAVTDLAERLGVSAAAVSRAVDALVRKRLVTRVEDKHDRRVRRVAVTGTGRDLAGELIAARMVGLEAFAASLSGAQRRKLDSAFDALLEREEIASTFEELKGVRTR